jgi:hypothetical protein
MKWVFSIIIVIAVVVTISYAQGHSSHGEKPAALQKIRTKNVRTSPVKQIKHPADTGLCFPIEKDHIYTLYSYIIDLRREKIRELYKPLFRKYNYEFTGYVWEGILENIIRNCPDAEIAHNTFVKAQDNMVFFTITRYKAVPRFPSIICPILCDKKRFEYFIKTADRNRINNF